MSGVVHETIRNGGLACVLTHASGGYAGNGTRQSDVFVQMDGRDVACASTAGATEEEAEERMRPMLDCVRSIARKAVGLDEQEGGEAMKSRELNLPPDDETRMLNVATAMMRTLEKEIDRYDSFVVAISLDDWNNGMENAIVHTSLSGVSDMENLHDMCGTYEDINPDDTSFFVYDWNDGKPRMMPLRDWWREFGSPDLLEILDDLACLVTDNEEGDEA